jgi:hypothetical protein
LWLAKATRVPCHDGDHVAPFAATHDEGRHAGIGPSPHHNRGASSCVASDLRRRATWLPHHAPFGVTSAERLDTTPIEGVARSMLARGDSAAGTKGSSVCRTDAGCSAQRRRSSRCPASSRGTQTLRQEQIEFTGPRAPELDLVQCGLNRRSTSGRHYADRIPLMTIRTTNAKCHGRVGTPA